jgi:hypothetical protein
MAHPDAYEPEPNCPLRTGLRPCMCDLPRCPSCGYTEHDRQFEGEHDDLCTGRIPECGQVERGEE